MVTIEGRAFASFEEAAKYYAHISTTLAHLLGETVREKQKLAFTVANATKPGPAQMITLDGYAVKELADLVIPDVMNDSLANIDQLDTEVSIVYHHQDGHFEDGAPMPKGYYAHLTDYPEAGCVALFQQYLPIAESVRP